VRGDHQRTRDRQQVAAALGVVAALVLESEEIVKTRVESNYSWLMVDVWLHDQTWPPEMTEPRKFAIWLETSELYRVGPDGAVDEDPISVQEALR
jgi:predicted outer membrane lipoprotein